MHPIVIYRVLHCFWLREHPAPWWNLARFIGFGVQDFICRPTAARPGYVIRKIYPYIIHTREMLMSFCRIRIIHIRNHFLILLWPLAVLSIFLFNCFLFINILNALFLFLHWTFGPSFSLYFCIAKKILVWYRDQCWVIFSSRCPDHLCYEVLFPKHLIHNHAQVVHLVIIYTHKYHAVIGQ